jgi:hypothetical protein
VVRRQIPPNNCTGPGGIVWLSNVIALRAAVLGIGRRGQPTAHTACRAIGRWSPWPSDQNGYTIVEADILDDAQALVKDHPFLSEGNGRFSIEIFELLPMPT